VCKRSQKNLYDTSLCACGIASANEKGFKGERDQTPDVLETDPILNCKQRGTYRNGNLRKLGAGEVQRVISEAMKR
jgi:hypothetical protein